MEGMTCRMRSWLTAAGIGVLLAIILWAATAYGFLASVFIGLLVALLIGMVLVWSLCEGEPGPAGSDTGAAGSAAAYGAGVVGTGAGAAAASGLASGAEGGRPDPAEPEGDAARGATDGGTASTPHEAGRGAEGEQAERAVRAPGEGGDSAGTEGGAGTSSSRQTPPAPEAEGSRPETLSGPRGGTPDDLKRIRGIGAKLEAQLHEMGVYHLDQIAGWSESEVAWVDENLPGFRGRVSRDDWVGQAKALRAAE